MEEGCWKGRKGGRRERRKIGRGKAGREKDWQCGFGGGEGLAGKHSTAEQNTAWHSQAQTKHNPAVNNDARVAWRAPGAFRGRLLLLALRSPPHEHDTYEVLRIASLRRPRPSGYLPNPIPSPLEFQHRLPEAQLRFATRLRRHQPQSSGA